MRGDWLWMALLAGGAAVALTALLLPLLGEPMAGVFGMGLGVALAVYVDRRWLTLAPAPARAAASIGSATAAGWALAQGIALLI